MTPAQTLILAALLPLASFVALIFFGKKMGRIAAWIATVAILASLTLALSSVLTWVAKSEFNNPHHAEALSARWIPLPANLLENSAAPKSLINAFGQSFLVGVLVDSLTIAMFVMIAIVASLVHIFSLAYMADDPRYSRYFAYLGLFCFSMFGLVLSNSLLQLFVFWELVGICSYLLIGFWFEKKGPALASKKAVVVNRVGDASFLLGLGLLLLHVGPLGLTFVENQAGTSGTTISVLAQSVDNALHNEAASTLNPSLLQNYAQLSAVDRGSYLSHNYGSTFLGLSWLTWAGICLFGGAMAKSAQFPLHVWLPDAMEGPTPVSALIHAATMVAAGVFLVARIYPILTMDARLFIAVIGCITLLMGALIALVQTDLKKVLAYSTISQLGFMMLFLGAGGYVAGLYHLLTHAFFKACLFLAAGSVIHALHHQQELRKMGGLWKKLPITAAASLVAVLAISGAPYFSGFYSKELGLASVYLFAQALPNAAGTNGGGYAMLLFWVPVIASFLTAFYMWRCWWLTFGGKSRDEDLHEHAHESPLMTFALIILAVLSLGFWFHDIFNVEQLLSKSLITNGTVFATTGDPLAIPLSDPKPLRVKEAVEHALLFAQKTTFWAFIVGPALAILLYLHGFRLAERLRRLPLLNLLHLWLREKMYFDALYDGLLVNFFKAFSATLAFLDKYLVDGLVNLAAFLTRSLARLANLIDIHLVDGLVNGTADFAHLGGRAILTPQAGRIRIYVLSLFSALALALLTTLILLALA